MSLINETNNFDFGDTAPNPAEFAPLAARLRPKTLNNYVGQQHLLADGQPLHTAINSGNIHSLVFWGPPGSGKTTLAEIIASQVDADIERVSAVTSGIKDIRLAIESAKQRLLHQKRKTIVFVDEVHRFNKSQQDAFLPHIEDGSIIFIGATTENPAFELNNAILSRARVYVLNKLSEQDLKQLIHVALTDSQDGLGQLDISLTDKATHALINFADGDARRLLNLFENAVTANMTASGQVSLDHNHIAQVAGSKTMLFDKSGDAFYDLLSAFHKSVRGSDPDAALYWYCRIIEAGGDAKIVARRLLAIASEDIGNADPRALEIGVNAWDTFARVGPAEGERAIAQAVVYMALAPKSNAVYQAFKQAKQLARDTGNLPVPLHLRNSTSELTQSLGHGQSYRYAHDEPTAFAAGENYFPEEIQQTRLYNPTERGLEIKLKQKREYLDKLNQQSNQRRYE